MTEMTEPALTPDEWKAQDADLGGGVRMARLEAGLALSITTEDVGADTQHLSTLAYVDRPAAVTALALYGQPFGFTHDDLEELDWRIEQAVKNDGVFLRSLRDRIAALLPPRETTSGAGRSGRPYHS